MSATSAEKELVGSAQGLLADGRRVWIARAGVEKLHQIKSIHVQDAGGLVVAELKDGNRQIFLLPGQLGEVLAETP